MRRYFGNSAAIWSFGLAGRPLRIDESVHYQPIVRSLGIESTRYLLSSLSETAIETGDRVVSGTSPVFDPILTALANHVPTATGHNQTAAPGTVIPLSTLFTYSDADGSSDIVSFDVRDQTSGGGHLQHNGSAWPDGQLTPDQPIGQISQWSYVVGSSGSVDMIGFNVTDKAGAFNPTVTATVSATVNHAPTATGQNQTAAPGTVIPLSTLFTYADADGLSDIVSFDVRDQTVGGGHLQHNGSAWPDGQLTPDQPIGEISQWSYVVGSSGSVDTIGFNVTDKAGAFNATVTATVSATVNHAPTATGHNQTAAPGTVIPLSTLFTYSDVDGSSDIVSFDVRDQTNGGGHLQHNGSAWPDGQLTPDQPIGEISQWSYVVGSNGSIDTIGFNVTDKAGAFNSTVTATVSATQAANQPPVVSGSNHSYSINQQHAVTELFSASDPDGSVATYNFYDSTPGAGYFTYDGAHISGTSISVSAANLSRVGYFTGTSAGTNDIACDVVDNQGATSATKTITVTVTASNSPSDDYPGDASTTGIVSVGSATTGTIGTTGDTDWFKVTLVAGHSYRFDLQAHDSGQGTLPDPFLRLRDSFGTSITFDDDNGNGLDSQIDYTATASGTYFLSAGSSTVTGIGTYRLAAADITPASTTDTIRGDVSTTAALVVGQTISSTIDNADLSGDPYDGDYFRVSLTAGHSYHFSATANVSSVDTLDTVRIRLRDSAGNIQTPDPTATGATPSFDFTPALSGIYFLAISASGGAAPQDKVGGYQVSLADSTSVGDDFADEASDSTAPIGAISVGGSRTGAIGPADANDTSGDKDVFQVSLVQGQAYEFRMTCSTLPAGVFTIRSGQNFDDVLTTSSVGFDVAKTIVADVTGAYYFRVGSGGSATDQGGYSVTVKNVTDTTVADDFKDDPNDTGSFGILNPNSFGKGVVEVAGDKDVFTTSVVAGHRYQFVLTGEAQGSAGALSSGYLTVRGPGFNHITGEGGSSQVTSYYYDADFTGTAYVRVGSGGDGARTGGYRLSVSTQATPPPITLPPSTDTPLNQAAKFINDTVSLVPAQLIKALLSDDFWYGLKLTLGKLNHQEVITFAHNISDNAKKIFGPIGIVIDWAPAINHVILAGDNNAAEQLAVEIVDNFSAWAFEYVGKIGGALGGFVLGGPIGGVIGTLALPVASRFIYEHFLQDNVRSEVDFLWDGVEDLTKYNENQISRDLNITEMASARNYVVSFDSDYYLSQHGDARQAIMSGAVGSAYDHFIMIGIDLGYQPNAGQTLARPDLAFTVLNNDPAVLGNSALFTAPFGQLSADGVGAVEHAVAAAAIAASGAAHGTQLDAALSAIAYRKALDVVANGAGRAVNEAIGKTEGEWATRWSDGSAFEQHFAGELDSIVGEGAPVGRYKMFVIASNSTDPASVLAALAIQNGWTTVGSNDTMGIAEYGGIWVVLLADRIDSYAVQTPGSDTLKNISEYGSSDADTLFAGSRIGHLFGLDGADTLRGGPGDDSLDGGAGSDTADYRDDTAGVIANLDTRSATGSNVGTDVLTSIENLIGGSGADTLTGDNSDNVLTGGAGNDVLRGDVAKQPLARVSVATDGSQANGGSPNHLNTGAGASISADGRYIAFVSSATNLVAGDTNDVNDVFVYDRVTHTTVRVSVASDGAQENGFSGFGADHPSISGDGRYIAFSSAATNLVAGDANGSTNDIYVYDRTAQAIQRVSINSDGVQGNNYSNDPSISADGQSVAFRSGSTNLVSGDTNGFDDIFVFNRATGATQRVSIASDGTQANGSSYQPVLSADGRYVVFWSEASNLVAGDTNGARDVFVFDRNTSTIERVSIASGGAQSNSGSESVTISGDGRFVAYSSAATNLIPGEVNSQQNIYVYDRVTHVTERASVALGGGSANSFSSNPSLSFDGRYLAFNSLASNLVAGDTNGIADVFVYDRVTHMTKLVSASDSGTQGNGSLFYSSELPSISADGRFVAFDGDAFTLVPADTNGTYDIFVADMATGQGGNDVLDGGAGNDTLVGGVGIDTAVFSGNRADYSVVSNGAGLLTVTDLRGGSPDGTDTISGVERLRFADVTLRLPTGTDFNGDIVGDVLFRSSGGGYASWQLSSTAISGGGNIGNPGGSYRYVVSSDFNGDGASDLLFRGRDGTLASWQMSGTSIVSGGTIGNP
ncbi:pre-peptidase C-terminal domain-containing protein, partial [Sphingomonas sp. RT2P30]|uniref:pre-peptidase C-terminal domain-containing protein n=1 Tax=Parasphingomonas halimpatiens TaxID=3096162 RepID=UPI002FCB14DF